MTKAKWLCTAAILLVAILGMLVWKHYEEPAVEETPAPMDVPDPAAEVVPSEKIEETGEPSADVILLAKIMQEEDGVDWPDMMIMALGEVVLNRVASPEYPGSIRGVLYQVVEGPNGERAIQYAPVHSSMWESITPEKHYIELAERLLSGERVLNDPLIIYQALFEQEGETILTYKDTVLGTKTYFCRTEHPELYTNGY